MASLELRNVQKTYGNAKVETLKNIALKIDAGEFLILVGIENLHKGEHIRRIPLEDLGVGSLLRIMNTVYDRGVVEGKFRPGVDPVELWLLLSSLCWFTVATSYTVDVTFGRNMLSPEELATRRGNIQEMVRRFLQK